MTEETLISECIKDNQKAQKALYESYLAYIYGICLRFHLPEKELKDIIQEIFIEIFLSLNSFDSQKGSLKYWIKAIAIHYILKWIRKKRIYHEEIDQIEIETGDWDIDVQHLEAEYLINMIRELPDGYRAIFNLYIIDGYSHKEIADMLGIKESSSRSQLVRAKKLLQERLLSIKNQ